MCVGFRWLEDHIVPIARIPARLLCRCFLQTLAGLLICGQVVAVTPESPFLPVQLTGKAPSSHVGSAMATLATLEEAQVLPPEGTRQANRIIQFVIQFQSAFTKGDDPAIQEFVLSALAARHSASAAAVLHEARTVGWTPELLVALSDAESRASQDELERLRIGLTRYNMTVEDFTAFMALVRTARGSLKERGLDFAQTFAAHRKSMPGHMPVQ